MAFGFLMLSAVHTGTITTDLDFSPASPKILTETGNSGISMGDARPDSQLSVASMVTFLGSGLLILVLLGFRKKKI